MGRRPLGDKPWKPYPSQLAALVAVADGCSLTTGGRKLDPPVSHQQMAQRLSTLYDRLGIKEPQTPAEYDQHHLSQWRRWKAIKICREHGWWPGDGQTPAQAVSSHRLTPDDVRAIRAAPHRMGEGARLAAVYGVHRTTISNIRTGKTWKDVT